MTDTVFDALLELHGELVKDLVKRVKSGEATAAEKAVAVSLLRHNGIEALPGTNKGLKELANALPFPEKGEEFPRAH